LTVNYETGVFSVSQCTWNDGAVPQIIPLRSNSLQGGNGNTTGEAPDKGRPGESTGLGAGSKAGIAIGVVGGVGIIGVIILFLRRKKHRRSISPTGTTPRATTISPDHTSTTNVVMKLETDTDIWSLSKDQEPVIPLHPLHHSRSELSGEIDAARELPAQDNREGNYFTDEQRMRSLRKAHGTPELDSAGFYELDGGPVPNQLSQVREEEFEGTTPTSIIQRSGFTAQQSDNDVSPIDSVRSPPQITLEPQNSWLDVSPNNIPTGSKSPHNETELSPGGVVSPISPFRRGSTVQNGMVATSRASRFNRRGSSRVGGPLSSNWSERSDRSSRSTRSEWSESDIYSAD
jgi:hypothetical protein